MATFRVSTFSQAEEGQSLGVRERQIRGDAQILALEVDRVFVEEGVSGSKPLKVRPHGVALLAALQPGDTIITAKLDCIFRSALDALEVLADLKDRSKPTCRFAPKSVTRTSRSAFRNRTLTERPYIAALAVERGERVSDSNFCFRCWECPAGVQDLTPKATPPRDNVRPICVEALFMQEPERTNDQGPAASRHRRGPSAEPKPVVCP